MLILSQKELKNIGLRRVIIEFWYIKKRFKKCIKYYLFSLPWLIHMQFFLKLIRVMYNLIVSEVTVFFYKK